MCRHLTFDSLTAELGAYSLSRSLCPLRLSDFRHELQLL